MDREKREIFCGYLSQFLIEKGQFLYLPHKQGLQIFNELYKKFSTQNAPLFLKEDLNELISDCVSEKILLVNKYHINDSQVCFGHNFWIHGKLNLDPLKKEYSSHYQKHQEVVDYLIQLHTEKIGENKIMNLFSFEDSFPN